ncbi:neurochondrin [Plakobranchus ocellatus]|uniref:Neurochondrin n=1 Tax=Plakobranchus ocellatus TaxID=259542 RepID=A0AAV4CFZ6_9GAST|nr:neurochondrin [Plakobranchus ocellatus]
MYAAHAKKHKEQASKSQLEESLELVHRARSDSDRFAALIEITHHVWAGEFTDSDKTTALKAVDHHLLAQLINTDSVPSEYPQDFYKSIALSVFAALSVEQHVMQFSEIKDIMCLVNNVIHPSKRYNSNANPTKAEMYMEMGRDCEDIIYNIAHLQGGTNLLLDSGTASLLLDYFPSCQHSTHILASIAAVLQHQGDAIFVDSAEKLNDAISMAVEKLGHVSNLTEKFEYAKILTSTLQGFSLIEVSVETAWVVPLASTLQKLILLKLHPDDDEVVLLLVEALVSATGPKILDPCVTGSFHLLKAVVARVSVEVYMQLDGIDAENASERYHKLDGVYKLLCGAVQCTAGLGEDADAESIIVVYRKLVDTRDTIIEFLFSVANQELGLPRNHSVVLISVRALAAMLTEITEEPSPNLLKLLPFFNLLCQPVEYADDVILEVKNATQAALENIKMMGMNSIVESVLEEEEEEENDGTQDGAASLQGKFETENSDAKADCANSSANEPLKSFGDLSLNSKEINHINHFKGSGKGVSSKSSTQASQVVDYSMFNGDATDNSKAVSLSPDSPAQNPSKSPVHVSSHSQPEPHIDLHLTWESIEEFKSFKEAVLSFRSKPVPVNVRKVSFSSRGKNSSLKSIQSGGPEQTPPCWLPGPDDVLGFLLPAYLFLVESEEVLAVMAESDSFQVIVNFLQRALSQLLEGKVSAYPEVMTTNALTLVEHVHTASPETAAKMHCFQDLFEIFMLSVPNLVSLPSPPPRVCLKLVETSLAAYKLQMMGSKKSTSLPRIKHSQARFFKAVVEYLKSVYEIRPHKKRPPSLVIAKDLRRIWSSLEESWTSCIAGLSELVTTVEELQDVLVKSSFLAEFLAFLRDSEVPSLEEFPDEAHVIVKALLPLLEAAAEASDHVCQLMLYNRGMEIARKFNLRKLAKHLVRFSKRTAS